MMLLHRVSVFVLTMTLLVPARCEVVTFLDARSAPGKSPSCTHLTNHGTHFTVDIEVGTPGQKFSVVADTGSNYLIVPSCVCQRSKSCSKSDRCFTGTNKSSTFSIDKGDSGPQSVFITFGSGTIEAVVAKEMVTVGHLSVDMQDGILLMVARQLNIAGRFEGILGLGVPANIDQKAHENNDQSSKSHGSSNKVKDLIKRIVKGIFSSNNDDERSLVTGIRTSVFNPVEAEIWEAQSLPKPYQAQLREGLQHQLDNIAEVIQTLDEDTQFEMQSRMANAARVVAGLSPHHGKGKWRRMRHPKQDKQDQPAVTGPKGLLEQAGIPRFSMCFNDGASGVMNFDTPAMEDSLGSIGEFHWGLDFRGVTVGGMSASLDFCSVNDMKKGQDTPCGAIPDSGTTVIMAPKDHLSELMDSICDQWPRCAQNYTAMVKAAEAAKRSATALYSFDPFEVTPAAKSAVLQLLLLDCGSWLNESTSLDELPPLKFHVVGANGIKKELELPGWAYVLESTRDDAEENKQLQGIDGDVIFLQSVTSHSRKVCSPAFGAMDYSTDKNGPVWILGTPIFYEFHVGYDLMSSPPSISFTSTTTKPCVSCGQQTSLLDAKRKDRHRPRWISGPLRIPDMDTNVPL